MTEEIIIDKEDKTKKYRNNEMDCLHFGCRKGESGDVLFWCDFYDDHCDNYAGCYYRKYLRLEQENKELKVVKEQLKKWNDENLKRQDDMQLWIDLAEEQRRKYRSALEEINLILDELKQQYDYMTDYSEIKEIQNKINEVLNS